MAQIIDGKGLAKRIREDVAEKVNAYKQRTGKTPKLTVVLIGEDPASQIYVRNKERGCAEVGMGSEVVRVAATMSEKEVIEMVRQLNKDKGVNGILVQLPLPAGIDEIRVLNEIDPAKDVDGLHPLNMGRLLKGENPELSPCTPQGIIEMILSTETEIKGKEVVVVGRSNIVGKPVAIMLLQRHGTVTICHSRTKDLGEVTRRADILVAAVGQPGNHPGRDGKTGGGCNRCWHKPGGRKTGGRC